MISSLDGRNRVLSNFWPSQVEFEGTVFPSVENAYQAAKSLDPSFRKGFLDLTPGKAKRQGRKLKDIRPDWDSVKLQVMEDLLRKKFSNRLERLFLIATGDQHIQEGNTWGDKFWGVFAGEGENHLGRLLMKIRGEIRTGNSID